MNRSTLLNQTTYNVAPLGLLFALAITTIGCAEPNLPAEDIQEASAPSGVSQTDDSATPEDVIEQDVTPTNPMVQISSGAFFMGTTHETGRWENEGPQHTVAFTRTFEMQAHEVTQGEWEYAFDSQPSKDMECGSDCPVETVNWYEALHYANWLSQSEGLETCYELQGCDDSCIGCGRICEAVEFSGLDCLGYRLPTEAEWEYSARAGTHTAFYSGIASNENKNNSCHRDESLDGIGWYCSNSLGGIHPVAQLSPNVWGLFDMSGNVQEWVWDRYGNYASRAAIDPTGPNHGEERIARGGAWDNISAGCRAAFREPQLPDANNNSTGFRLVKTSSH